LLAGAERNYENLIEPIEEKMIRSVWRITRNPDDADDAMQEALTVVWKRLDKIRGHPNPQALILRICINAAYGVLRRKLRRRRRELKLTPARTPDPAPSAAERLSAREKQEEVIRCITRLPRRQAEAAFMRFVQELSYGEIARALGCSEVTARKHIARGRARLRTLLAHLTPGSTRRN
jgi:RNA polymerase sigma-70 factor (ECF subfamily)